MLVVFVVAIVLGGGRSANADYTFGEPTNLGPTVNSSAIDGGGIILADGLELYFNSWRSGQQDIWVTTRPTTDDPWGPPVNLGPPVNSSAWDGQPSISPDGLSLYFASERPGGHGNLDLYMTRRATTDDPWGTLVNLGPTVNSSANDWAPSISPDGFTLYFASQRPGGYGGWDLWVTTRATKEDDWGTPVNLGPTVNSSSADSLPSISADGLSLFFSDYQDPRPGGYGDADIWVTMRATVSDPWGTPVNLGPPVNGLAHDGWPGISPDGSTLFFASRRPGGSGSWDLWQVSISPVVDLNRDGIVDSEDMCIMVDHWGTDEPLSDIGPMPWGDGIIDVQDLVVLSEYLFTYPGAVAYWKLDETEGDTAYDSVGVYDGLLNGVPTWQPDGGQINGALGLDGINDYVSTPFILDPAAGAFSVFAWVKGGTPGQVVISQIFYANWLLTDPAEGKLMTELKVSGRSGNPLWSQTVITDSHWHRIGLVWDGSNIMLYVDDIEEAKDTQSGLTASGAGLYIGAGKTLEQGSFFSGLIDDVRIYNRAVTP